MFILCNKYFVALHTSTSDVVLSRDDFELSSCGVCVKRFDGTDLSSWSLKCLAAQKTVVTILILAAPFLSWYPEGACESRGVLRIEELFAVNAVPVGMVSCVTRLHFGLPGMRREIQIEKIIARLDVHLIE
jgi:hypothetical protein